MVEEIARNLYKIEIPLPNSPLKALNSYVVKGLEQNLMIDTGWNQEECLNAMRTGLKKLGVDIRETDFFITHLHSDHFGLVSNLSADTSLIYFNQPDADRFHAGIQLSDFVSFARLNGFPEDELQAAIRSHPGFKFRSEEHLVFHILKEGDPIRIGDYAFKCVETPGHRSVFRNCRERIQELKDHHQKRMDEIVSILEKGCQNAFRIGSLMSWDIVYDFWDAFPVTQKWFAIGEVIAHLKHLEKAGVIRSETRKKRRVYSFNMNG